MTQAKKDLKDFRLMVYLLKESIKTVSCGLVVITRIECDPRWLPADLIQDRRSM